ncbi:RRP12-like protein [Nilaparvata lugens]|uniref:RRP12-like protein n=1 Tax=Nilaparvata lugens TaxID=108931 RepID=UPI00193E2A3E|nr:RRP12-like protein [Nilaparvata lugens]
MAKFKHRIRCKGKKWKKGSSSSSNPSTTTYRDKARSFFFQDNVGSESLLTTEALKQHDSFVQSSVNRPKPMEQDEEDDVVSLSASSCRTTDTFATDFSGCTNVSYSKLLNSFDPSSAIQKEKLAVLAAISEVIKSNGGTENNTEYYGALMTMLENTECEEMSVAAVLSLLAMGIKSVPQAVLNQTFSQSCKILIDVLAKNAESNNNTIYRGALACLSVLLRNQPFHVWKDSSTIKVFDTVLMFTTHSKPKVRKAAQNAVSAVLRASAFLLSQPVEGQGQGQAHPGAAVAAEFCCRQIDNNGTLNTSITSTLHILGLLKDIMCTFPKKHLKLACETVLKVMTVGNVVVTSCGLQALHGLFVAAGGAAGGGLSAELNAQLVTALYDYQPPATDAQPTQAWLAVMQQAHAALARSNLSLCMQHLPRLLSTAVALWLSARPDVMNAATLTIKACLEDCVAPAAATLAPVAADIDKVVQLMRSTLTYKYHGVWSHVLHLFGVLFKACGKSCSKALLPCLKELAELRDSAVFAYMNELDYCLGMAVRSLGPELVLLAIPLQFTGKNIEDEFKRSWLLPVLRENVQLSTLKCFIDNFLPIAVECRNKSEELKNVDNKSNAVSYDLLQSQIWSLLPSFCSHAIDITDSFSRIAKALGSILGSRKDLRIAVMAALRKLIVSVKDTNNVADAKEIAKYAKNYLPILFNIYTTPPVGSEEAGIRLAALETIKVYLTLADTSLCSEMFEKAMLKLSSDGLEAFVKESVLDLVRALLPFQTVDSINALYNSTVANIQQVNDHKEEKKYFRCLEEICRSETEGCTGFLIGRFNEVNQLLLTSLSSTSPSSRGPRLRCLLYLLERKQLPSDDLEKLIGESVAEAVVCCLDINSRCRATAYDVINKMADRCLEAGTFDKFLEIVLSGLASSPRVISATLLALASITYNCKQAITEDVLKCLLSNVFLLVCSSTREIVRSALSYIKLYITSFSQDSIASHVSALITALSNMTDDCKRHFRLKTRDILARLVRWYGADSVMSLIPAGDTVMMARVRNLKKIQSRKKKSREQELEAKKQKADDLEFFVNKKPKSIDEILAESDSDMDDDLDDVASRKSNKAGGGAVMKKAPKAWIQENADSFMDFTSSDANRKITTSKPTDGGGLMAGKVAVKAVDKNRGFKTAPDGRLIIKDDDNDEGGAERRRFTIPGLDSEDDDSDLDDAKSFVSGKSLGKSVPGRKRKMSVSSEVSSLPPIKYQAGGSGIHRPISSGKSDGKMSMTKTKTKEAGVEYRSKKAKGDVKRKGMPDPYAYLPLQRSSLNRRKKMKAAGQFRSIVSGARKGAKIGAKKRVKMGK